MPEQQPVDTSVLKQSRQACHQARNAFFACIEGLGLEFALDLPVPDRCSGTRAAYEAACRDSWVTHFDTLHDKETKFNRRKRVFEAQQSAKQQGARSSVKGGTSSQSAEQ
jgi:cytochrome c oxidase assembly factor 6